MNILIGTTDRTVTVFIPDPSSTDGSGKTGLVAANLTVSYTRVETDNDVVVQDATGSLNDLSALTDPHNDWGVKEVSSSLAPGLYRLDIADAVFATGAWEAIVYVMITTSAAAASPTRFMLTSYDPIAGTGLSQSDVRDAIGMTTNDLDTQLDAIKADTAAILTDTGTTLDGKLNTLQTDVTTIKGQTDDIGVAGAGLTAVPWNAAWDAEVQSECNDAIVANDLDHVAFTATGIPVLPAGTFLGQILARTPSATSITNMNIVFTTDFATNYDTGSDQWNTSSTFVLADGAITSAKLADGCFTNSKFANGAIDSRVVADGTIDSTTLDNSVLEAIAQAVLVDFICPEYPAQDPAATASFSEMVGLLYKMATTKKTSDGGEIRYFHSDSTTVDLRQDVSDSGGIVTKARIEAAA